MKINHEKERNLFKLSKQHVEDIINKGYADVLVDGLILQIRKEDLLFKKSDLEKHIKEQKNGN